MLCTGNVAQPLQGHSGAVWSWPGNNQLTVVATGSSEGSERLWSAATGAADDLLQLHANILTVKSVVLNPDGLLLAWTTTTRLRWYVVWGVATSAISRISQGHTGIMWSVTWLSSRASQCACGALLYWRLFGLLSCRAVVNVRYELSV